jgi:hypothetical protein
LNANESTSHCSSYAKQNTKADVSQEWHLHFREILDAKDQQDDTAEEASKTSADTFLKCCYNKHYSSYKNFESADQHYYKPQSLH